MLQECYADKAISNANIGIFSDIVMLVCDSVIKFTHTVALCIIMMSLLFNRACACTCIPYQ